MNLPRANRTDTAEVVAVEKPRGLVRRQIARVATAMAGKSVIPAGGYTDVGWTRVGGLSDSAFSRTIDDFLATYGGESAITWIFACTRLICEEMGMYPYHFVDPTTAADLSRCKVIDYKKAPSDLKELLREPNERMSWYDFMAYKEMDTELVGNSYWLKDQRNALGQPFALRRLRPEFTRIATDNRGMVIGYAYLIKGVWLTFTADEVMHFVGLPNPHSEYYGMGTVQGILDSANIELGVGRHVVGFFANGARISGVLTISGQLQEDSFERLRQQFREEYVGAENHFSILIAEQGMDFKPITQAPSDTTVGSLSGLSKDGILSGFGVHQEMLGGTSNAGDVKMSDAWKIFTRKMRPRARRNSERLTIDLVGLWGQTIGIWISTTDIETQEVKVARARDMLGAGATVSESRVEMGLVPVTRENFPHLDDDTIAIAHTPILPSGYDPFFVVQQAPNFEGGARTDILPGGSNGNSNGSVNPSTPVGDGDREVGRMVTALNGKALLELPSGQIVQLPDGFERPGELSIRYADEEESARLLAIQARIYGEELPNWRAEMVGFFNDQRDRVLRELGKFRTSREAKSVSRARSKQVLTKKDLAAEAIFDLGQENAYLVGIYGVRALGAAQWTANELGAVFAHSPIEVRRLVGEMAGRVHAVNEFTLDRLRNQISVGMKRNYSLAQIASGVPEENYLGVSGVFNSAVETRADSVARLEIATLHTVVSLATYSQLGYKQVEVMDGAECGEHGEVWSLEVAGKRPIGHHRCMRLFLPIAADRQAV